MDESVVRFTLVEIAARLWSRGLVAGTSGNLSARLDDGRIVATPTLRSLRALAPRDLVLLDPAGTPLDPDLHATSELPLHMAAYRARSDITCVVHTHPTYCTGWSKTGALFPLDTVGAIESLGAIVLTPYARAGSRELAERCASALAGGADAVVLARHGLSVVAATLERAFEVTDLAEQTARIEFCAATLALGKGKRAAEA